MKSKRVYFPPTTPQQRKLLFEIWEQSQHVTAACQKAHVGRATFYYWKTRFEKEGCAGLESYETLGAPKGSGRVRQRSSATYWNCTDKTRIGANIA